MPREGKGPSREIREREACAVIRNWTAPVSVSSSWPIWVASQQFGERGVDFPVRVMAEPMS